MPDNASIHCSADSSSRESMTPKKPVSVYVPHGHLPDPRGFSPAIVAWKTSLGLHRYVPEILALRAQGEASHDRVNGVDIHRIGLGRVYRRLFTKITRLDPWPLDARAAAMVKKSRPLVVHAHQLEFPVRRFLRRLPYRPKIVVHAHVTSQRFIPERGLADLYVAVSRFVKAEMIQQGYPEERIRVVPNGVDTDLFAPVEHHVRNQWRTHRGIPLEAPVILFFGRKQEVKGFDLYLRAMQQILARRSDVIAVAIGGEPRDSTAEPSFREREMLRSQLARSGRFFDFPLMDHAELAVACAAADMAYLPSRAETQGMMVLESMAAGCVTVSSDLGGIRESIDSGRTGYLLSEPEDVGAAVACLDMLLAKPRAELDALRTAARQAVMENFSWPAIAAKTEVIYDEVLA